MSPGPPLLPCFQCFSFFVPCELRFRRNSFFRGGGRSVKGPLKAFENKIGNPVIDLRGWRGSATPTHPWRSHLWRERLFYLGKSRKEDQEDQGDVKKLRGNPLAVLRSPGPPCLSSGSSLGSLELPQRFCFEAYMASYQKAL